MDANERIDSNLIDHNKDDQTKYSHHDALQYERNKLHQEIGSNNHNKSVRPCAVVGPDRVIPYSRAEYQKKDKLEAWPSYNNEYCNDLHDYSQKVPDYQSTVPNISPRLTYQENMSRVMVQPRYTSNKIHDETSVDVNSNLPVSVKNIVTPGNKYCEVPYDVSAVRTDQINVRNTELCASNLNVNTAVQNGVWPSNNTNVNSSGTFKGSELYQQYTEYSPSVTSASVPIARPMQMVNEESSHPYPDNFYHPGSVRYRPYPVAKERCLQQRYEYNYNQYPNAFHSPSFPHPNKYDIQKPVSSPYPVSSQIPMKFRDNRIPDQLLDYQRNIPGSQQFYNSQYHNQVMHTPYPSMSGFQHKISGYNTDINAKIAVSNKLTYDYETYRLKGYPLQEGYYPNEMLLRSNMKNQHLATHSSSNVNMRNHYPYYRKDINYDYYSHCRNVENYPLSNHLPRQTPHYSPDVMAPPLYDGNPNDIIHIHLNPQKDVRYKTYLSNTTVGSVDSLTRLQADSSKKYKHDPTKTSQNMSKSGIKQKKDINVRQFLQMWNEGEEDNREENESIESASKSIDVMKTCENINSQEQLYVLGLVDVPSEELGKYEHIQKVSKLPENIKGYNNIELLKQFEEVIQSSNVSNAKYISHTSKNLQNSANNNHKTENLPRPLSPLDVEAKISQSVIHKEVGCNFEIKPCSPQMLNVEIAAPAHSLVEERIIEKVTNTFITKQPLNNCSENVDTLLTSENAKILNCNMTDVHSSLKNNYTLQDLEGNSGICFASLPRLDNDIELSFPEVNQQFIDANKTNNSQNVINSPETVHKCISTSHFNSVHNMNKSTELKKETVNEIVNNSLLSISENSITKLTKFRKIKNSLDQKDTINKNLNDQAVRKDSVIIKNPDNKFGIKDNISISVMEIEERSQNPINLSTQIPKSNIDIMKDRVSINKENNYVGFKGSTESDDKLHFNVSMALQKDNNKENTLLLTKMKNKYNFEAESKLNNYFCYSEQVTSENNKNINVVNDEFCVNTNKHANNEDSTVEQKNMATGLLETEQLNTNSDDLFGVPLSDSELLNKNEKNICPEKYVKTKYQPQIGNVEVMVNSPTESYNIPLVEMEGEKKVNVLHTKETEIKNCSTENISQKLSISSQEESLDSSLNLKKLEYNCEIHNYRLINRSQYNFSKELFSPWIQKLISKEYEIPLTSFSVITKFSTSEITELLYLNEQPNTGVLVNCQSNTKRYERVSDNTYSGENIIKEHLDTETTICTDLSLHSLFNIDSLSENNKIVQNYLHTNDTDSFISNPINISVENILNTKRIEQMDTEDPKKKDINLSVVTKPNLHDYDNHCGGDYSAIPKKSTEENKLFIQDTVSYENSTIIGEQNDCFNQIQEDYRLEISDINIKTLNETMQKECELSDVLELNKNTITLQKFKSFTKNQVIMESKDSSTEGNHNLNDCICENRKPLNIHTTVIDTESGKNNIQPHIVKNNVEENKGMLLVIDEYVNNNKNHPAFKTDRQNLSIFVTTSKEKSVEEPNIFHNKISLNTNNLSISNMDNVTNENISKKNSIQEEIKHKNSGNEVSRSNSDLILSENISISNTLNPTSIVSNYSENVVNHNASVECDKEKLKDGNEFKPHILKNNLQINGSYELIPKEKSYSNLPKKNQGNVTKYDNVCDTNNIQRDDSVISDGKDILEQSVKEKHNDTLPTHGITEKKVRIDDVTASMNEISEEVEVLHTKPSKNIPIIDHRGDEDTRIQSIATNITSSSIDSSLLFVNFENKCNASTISLKEKELEFDDVTALTKQICDESDVLHTESLKNSHINNDNKGEEIAMTQSNTTIVTSNSIDSDNSTVFVNLDNICNISCISADDSVEITSELDQTKYKTTNNSILLTSKSDVDPNENQNKFAILKHSSCDIIVDSINSLEDTKSNIPTHSTEVCNDLSHKINLKKYSLSNEILYEEISLNIESLNNNGHVENKCTSNDGNENTEFKNQSEEMAVIEHIKNSRSPIDNKCEEKNDKTKKMNETKLSTKLNNDNIECLNKCLNSKSTSGVMTNTETIPFNISPINISISDENNVTNKFVPHANESIENYCTKNLHNRSVSPNNQFDMSCLTEKSNEINTAINKFSVTSHKYTKQISGVDRQNKDSLKEIDEEVSHNIVVNEHIKTSVDYTTADVVFASISDVNHEKIKSTRLISNFDCSLTKQVKNLKDIASEIVNRNVYSSVENSGAQRAVEDNKCKIQDNMKPISLKRSLSESAIDLYGKISEEQIFPSKRKRIEESTVMSEKLCNIIQNTRRNSIQTICNEDVSFCILIDDGCLIEESIESESICLAEIHETCVSNIEQPSSPGPDILESESNLCQADSEFRNHHLDEDRSIDESWVNDVACIETVTATEIAEDISITQSPKNESKDESTVEECFMYGSDSDHTDKVKYIYGENVCGINNHLVEELYRTPQMNVNKRLTDKQSIRNEILCYVADDLINVLSESQSDLKCSQPDSKYGDNFSSPLFDSVQDRDSDFQICGQNDEHLKIKSSQPDSKYENSFSSPLYDSKKDRESGFQITGQHNEHLKYKDLTVSQSNSNISVKEINKPQKNVSSSSPSESTKENIYEIYKSNVNQHFISSSPEVSSTTPEEKNPNTLLKTKGYTSSITHIDETTNSKSSQLCSKIVQNKDYLNYKINANSSPGLLTKAAKKYIPPLKETIPNLKVHIPLPHSKLLKLKQLKLSRELKLDRDRKINTNKNHNMNFGVKKKEKPKFEDVLKSIDAIQFQKHKERNTKSKKIIPKVVIKKTVNGSHYSSISDNTQDPDLTGRKWQPWVFLERNKFIDKMAIKRKSKAVYSHKKKSYVLIEKFQKYKPAMGTAEFVITHPNLEESSRGHLKYTIRLRQKF